MSWVAREDGLEHITSLNIGGNASEEYANCLSGSIDLSDLSEVSSVWIGSQEGVTELDLSGLTKLEMLNVQFNTNLTVLNLEGVYSLRDVWITGTGISSLNLAGNTDLQRLTCQSNRLSA